MPSGRPVEEAEHNAASGADSKSSGSDAEQMVPQLGP